MQTRLNTAAWLYACLFASALLCNCSSSDNSGSVTSDVSAGEAALTKYNCRNCHGQDLSGSTSVVPGTKAYPANLTPDKDTGIGDWDTATIKQAILTGTDDEGATLCSTMPVFSKMNMNDAEATSIANYLQTIPAVKKLVPESDCPDATGAAGSMAGAGGAGK